MAIGADPPPGARRRRRRIVCAPCALAAGVLLASSGYAAGEPFAYVANEGDDDVTPIDLATNTAGTPIPVENGPIAVAITPDGATAYVTTFQTDRVTPIDIATNSGGTPIDVGDQPRGVAITPDGSTAYVSNLGSDDVTPIDVATSTPGTPINVGDVPRGVAITPDGTTAYVANRASDDVIPINVATNTAGTPIDVGDQPIGIAITPSGGTAYVGNLGDDDVTPIDVATNTAGTPIDVGDAPVAIAITPDGATAYVVNAGDDDVAPIDVASNTAGTPIDVGDAPADIAITPDGATAYVTNRNGDDVTPIDVASNTAGTPIDVGGLPAGIAITPTIEAAADRAAIDFGGRDVGDGPTAPQMVTIESTGSGNVVPAAATLSGANPSQFAITADGCAGQTLQPAQTCTVSVAFDPDSTGAKAATLQIPSNDPDSPTQVALSGNGTVPPSPAPIVPPPAPSTADSVCADVPPRRTSDKDRIRLTQEALVIQQRIDAAALRRLNAANVWLDQGIVPSDLCAHGFGAGAFQEWIVWVGGGPVGPATVADPRGLQIIKLNKPPGRFTLSLVQIRINERISKALFNRAVATAKRLRELTGGDLARGAQLGPRERYPGLTPGGPLPPSTNAEPSELEIAPLRIGRVTFSAAQLRKTQRQSQRAIILANRANDRIRAGLTEEQFIPGSLGAARIG